MGKDYYRNREYGRENSSKMHFHNLMEVAVCRFGHGNIITEKQKYSYKEGTIVIIPANIPHAVEENKDEKSLWEYLYLNPVVFMQQSGINERQRKAYFVQAGECIIVKQKEDAAFLEAEINLLMDQIRVKEYGYQQCVCGLIYTLLMEMIKTYYYTGNEQKRNMVQRVSQSKRVTRILEYVDRHYAERIRTEDMANAIYVSPSCLRKIFKDNFRMSPIQYVNYVRIQKACEMIRKTDDNISEIARKAGYDNLATFINNFKLYMGETPKQWKEKL